MVTNSNNTGEPEPEPEDGAEAARAEPASEKFINDLLIRGEAVYEGEEPTSSTTHIIARGDDGRLTARRLRFH